MSPAIARRARRHNPVVAPAPRAPFGEADGSRTNLDANFISFDGHPHWGGLATRADDFSTRILVGRKGSGKTVYLRRLRATAADDSAQYADEICDRPPDTATILDFSRLFNDCDQILGWWSKLWNRAILRSLASHVLCNRLAQRMNTTVLEDLREFETSSAGRLLRRFMAPISPYKQLEEIVHEYHSRNPLEAYLNNPLWADLEAVLAHTLKGAPPIYFFLDALDEHFEESPQAWLKCQEGLFFETIQFLRGREWNRLHLTVCLRDVVYASMLQSEHKTRFAGDSHIRQLNWHRSPIEAFLDVKLAQLDRRHFLGDTGSGKTVHAWLNLTEITNEKRGIREPIGQYILRHTRLLPRDVVIMGNSLCAAVEKSRQEPWLSIEEHIRRKVHDAASVFGHEQFRICANEVLSYYMPHTNPDACDNPYAEPFSESLKSMVRDIRTDRFDRSRLDQARRDSEAQFGCDPFSAMWRNGLIGYVDGPAGDERHIFYDHDSLNSFELPSAGREFVLHPIVIDAAGINSSGPIPVVPYF
jgi:hypothetical protein